MNSEFNDMNLFDFIVLCMRKLKGFFVWFGSLFHTCVVVGWKRWYIILAGFILGVVFAWFWSRPMFTRYTGDVTIVFPEDMKVTIEEGLQCFNSLTPQEKWNEYGIPYNIQKSMKFFKYYNWIDAKCDSKIDYIDYDKEVSPGDTLNKICNDRLALRIKLVGPEGFPFFEKAIAKFFNEQPEYVEPARRWRESKQLLIDETKYEVARTDSFVNHDYFHQDHTLLVVDSFSLGQQNILHYKDINELRYIREYLVEQLARTPDVVNFQTHFHLSSMRAKEKYMISAIVGVLLALVVSLLIENRKQVYTYLHPEK